MKCPPSMDKCLCALAANIPNISTAFSVNQVFEWLCVSKGRDVCSAVDLRCVFMRVFCPLVVHLSIDHPSSVYSIFIWMNHRCNGSRHDQRLAVTTKFASRIRRCLRGLLACESHMIR